MASRKNDAAPRLSASWAEPSETCTNLYINVSLVFALALASVVNYARKWHQHHSLERHLLMILE